jgi:hypothetical protein
VAHGRTACIGPPSKQRPAPDLDPVEAGRDDVEQGGAAAAQSNG